MQCEICGAEIRDKPSKVMIEGSELDACPRCAQYGTSTNKRKPVSRKIAPVAQQPSAKKSRPRPARPDPLADIKEELVEDYNNIIRDSREKLNWTQEELALKIKEKESLIKKIERGDIVPEDSVLKKIERALDVTLTERVGEDDWSGDNFSRGTTLGDIVKIKRK
ncbi:transcriptional regulator, XRE family [Methanosalsum zhilinae DSM 4017]|uniref:Transcriptional regulator, XRE family n=1 Tax=Methanosalsum zhilinae (strain DSM 4017 / NBRC 107636 / OCM 62 / WeN5) TaxID=679901 RepID=F7XQP8_METZD|nr:multiprotein bridging factor aMBF1 [Methanosalsum zhilinae]AEH61647.1 transcriptional regulator, XRE family [Methanosalsum zhilinae DSM 4017]